MTIFDRLRDYFWFSDYKCRKLRVLGSGSAFIKLNFNTLKCLKGSSEEFQ